MSNYDINFLEWMRKFTNPDHNPDSDLIIYKNNAYTEEAIFELYTNLKLTQADIRAFNTFITISLRREEYLSMEEVKEYVSNDIISTAEVIRIIQKGAFNDNKDVIILNTDYVPIPEISTQKAKIYLKK